ncbi:MAG: T9SS type A sorting domain-containing protein [Saprospiraceae bacterium]|nr:T9SS type A sorting domain-containing protein [Saprospiraceae bacterium]MCB9325106.1 T9SS type A sorting domain-containing protein [Lewinellaceae bacterium]
MKQLIAILTLIFSLQIVQAQMVSLTPSGAGADELVTLTFDATEGNGELVGASKVYMHHGVVLGGPDATDWNYVIGNWGQDDGVGEMTKVPGETDKWEITFSPTLRAYFGVPESQTIYRISCVFRSSDGSTKATTSPGDYGWGTVASNLDIYVNLNANNYIGLSAPTGDLTFINSGENVAIEAFASSNVSSMKIFIDEGSGYEEKASVTSGTSIAYSYVSTATVDINIKVTATVNGEDLEVIKPYQVVVITDPVVEELPEGMVSGINYNAEDDTKVTLVLQAPGKGFVYAVGDFSNWMVQEQYHMKRTPDGEMFWVEISGLTPMQKYVYQYWIDGTITVGDPYADQVADPWNDHWIESDFNIDLPDYDKTEFGPATVFQTGQEPYAWNASENDWQRPDPDHLIIYELHVRDFVGSHYYQDLIDSLSYLKRLGVDAIELMPVNEFEGNDSWGYNPSYFFAPDKYYGTKNDLKAFIEAAHEEGIAVIMDIVLNHAFGQNPMVRMYFNESTGKPSPDNPWFNENYVGPYQWGYDFNHESNYTKAFVDRVNAYWLQEYHFDGFRFDFTKGFTNYAPGGSIDGFDQSRINILERMADKIWEVDSEAYIILEHWAPASEETILGNYGMKMWRNRSYDYVPAITGATSGSFSSMDIQTHVSYFDSHDERRLAEHALSEGQNNGSYDVRNPLVMYERAKMSAAFTFLFPGPKMIWEFDELGYDIDIDFNGRVGRKPLPWGPDGLGYYEDSLRQYIFEAYTGILEVRNQVGPEAMASAVKNHKYTGNTRRLSYNTPGIDLVVIGNFGLNPEDISPQFPQTGTWYDYFSGDSLEVVSLSDVINLKAGEWHIYTSENISQGFPGVVEVFEDPVTITPMPFTKNDEIVIRFDATKAQSNGTAGLIGADKVYIHSGVLIDHPDSTELSHIVGNLADDGLGEMVEVEEDIWEITLTPADYFAIAEDNDIYKLGMYFRDADNVNLGMGFRNSIIYKSVASGLPFITINPPAFDANTPITITFNAKQGNRELVGEDKVYMHSSIGTVDTENPQTSAWDNAVGNWGMDDGVGKMTPVPGAIDLWKITLVPQSYYGLSAGEFPYWLAAVFRSADGNKKGTGTPGPLENGFIASNLDFFIRNEGTVSVNDWTLSRAEIFPNPTSGFINLSEYSGDLGFELFGADGKLVFSKKVTENKIIHLPDLPNGIYFYKIDSGHKLKAGKLVLF